MHLAIPQHAVAELLSYAINLFVRDKRLHPSLFVLYMSLTSLTL